MSNWLTTGEMIDRLKVGEVAEGRVKHDLPGPSIYKDKTGHIKFENGDSLLEMTAGITSGTKWRILPKYVSLEEAMKASKEGKVVALHRETGIRKISPFQADKHRIGATELQDSSLMSIFEGKWTIEDNPND